MMEYFDLISARYSVRAYKSDPVEEDKLLQVLNAARLAPTADNRQPFKIIVIHTENKEMELRKIYNREWFTQAPLILCACGIPRLSWIRRDQRRYLDVDVAIVMDHLILAATDLGLGTCWIAAFNAAAAREVLALPDEIEPLIFTPLGYPAISAPPKERKPLDELVRYEAW
jgi:nitroreductase